MGSFTATFRITDDGKFHSRFFQIKLISENNGDEIDERLQIKYPGNGNYIPCSVLEKDGCIYLWAAMVGKMGDIKMRPKEWLRSLKVLGSRTLFKEWEEKIVFELH